MCSVNQIWDEGKFCICQVMPGSCLEVLVEWACEVVFLSHISCGVCVLCQFPDGPLESGWYAPCTSQHKTKGTLCRWWLRGREHTVCGDRVDGTGERTPSNIDTTLVQYTLHTPHENRNMKTTHTPHITTCHSLLSF